LSAQFSGSDFAAERTSHFKDSTEWYTVNQILAPGADFLPVCGWK
jgi:hypothetical protein